MLIFETEDGEFYHFQVWRNELHERLWAMSSAQLGDVKAALCLLA